jgi:hypothetical protein
MKVTAFWWKVLPQEWQRKRALIVRRRELEEGRSKAWDESERKIEATKDPSKKEFLSQEQYEDMCQFDEEIRSLDSKDIIRRAERCHLSLSDFPLPEGETSHWEDGNYGSRYINPKTLREFIKCVESAEHERAKRRIELNDFKVKIATVIFAAIAAIASAVAAIASIINLLNGSRH